MQAQKDAYNRRHNDHQHSMSLSIPRKDNRGMDIPEGTFEPVQGGKLRLPFRYLRTWIFSLLALVCLPAGIMLFLIGTEMEEDVDRNWEEVTAEVTRYDGDEVRFEFGNDDGSYGFRLDDYIDIDSADRLTLTVSACDLVNRVIIPKEEGKTFSLWVNPRKDSEYSCLPVGPDFFSFYIIGGSLLVIFSVWRLIRTIHSAGARPAA